MRGRKLSSLRLVLKLYLPVTMSVLAISLIGALIGYFDHKDREEADGDRAGQAVSRELANFLVNKLASERHDEKALQRLAKQLDRQTHINLSVYSVDGTLWAHMGPWSLGPLSEDEIGRLRRGSRGLTLDNSSRIVVSASDNDEIVAYGLVSLRPHIGSEFRARPRRGLWGFLPGLGRPPYWVPPPLLWTMIVLLVVLAFVSSLFVRDLAKPLLRLSATARAFGEGDLSARAKLKRTDELGELGHTFDEMADRVTSLLRAQTELMASASHELRTPLARARVALDIASEGDAELAKEHLGEIAIDLEELEGLVSDILIMAKLDLERGLLDGPRQPLRFEMIPAQVIIDEAIE